ncbi:transposase [Streptomyces hyaluromycini]|uniref:Transposase n=1 Tax=Streptomyces hyaluromycini TaxID=1377993 RepID=A0ABV1WXK9_9ACTN
MKRYLPEFKASATALYDSRSEATIKRIAACPGVNRETLRNWRWEWVPAVRAARWTDDAGSPRGYARWSAPSTGPAAPRGSPPSFARAVGGFWRQVGLPR